LDSITAAAAAVSAGRVVFGCSATSHQHHRRDSVTAYVDITSSSIHQVKWRHGAYGHDTIAILWV